MLKEYNSLLMPNQNLSAAEIRQFRATIAIWDLTRPLRWVNVSLAAGALILACSLVKGNPTHRFGGGWSSLWKG